MSWEYAGWGFRGQLDVEPLQVPGDKISPAIIIDLETHFLTQPSFWANVKANGGDLRATTGGDENETAVPLEVVWIDVASETGQVAIKWAGTLDQNGVDATLLLYWGNAAAEQPAVTDPIGRNAVWSDYHCVVHMTNVDVVVDSAGNYGDLTSKPLLGQFTLIDGPNGSKGVTFNDINQEHFASEIGPAVPTNATSFTVLMQRPTTGGNGDTFVVLDSVSTVGRVIHRGRNDTTFEYRLRVVDTGNAGVNVSHSGFQWNTIQLIQTVLNATNLRSIDVEEVGRITNSTVRTSAPADTISIGNDPGGGNTSPEPGSIYECRWINRIQTAADEEFIFNQLRQNFLFWNFIQIETEPTAGAVDASGSLQVTVRAQVSGTADTIYQAFGIFPPVTLDAQISGTAVIEGPPNASGNLLTALATTTGTAVCTHFASDEAGVGGLGVDPATIVGLSSILLPQDLNAIGNLIAQPATIQGRAGQIPPGVLRVSSKALYPQVLQGNPAVILARILGIDGNFIIPEIVDDITYDVFDVTSTTPSQSIFTGTEDPLTAILPVPDPTDPRWKKDDIGPNFISEVPGAAFPLTTRHTRIEYAFTLATLEVIRYKRDLEVVDLIAIPG